MIKIKSRKKAFSLIELSIALLIISILAIGISTGNRLISTSKIIKAQALTKTSPVSSIPDLLLWLEPTLSGSITGATSGNDLSEDDYISAWNDISGNGISVIQGTQANQPTYTTSGINSLPSLSFTQASSNYLYSTSKVPLQPGDDSFTFVAVWKRIGGSGAGVMFEQNTNGSSSTGKRASMLTIGTTLYGFNGESNDFHANAYTAGESMISVITLTPPTAAGTTIDVKIYSNSNDITYSGTINADTENVSTGVFVVGAKALATKTSFFPGYISEIMVFDRDITPTEISIINKYLSKKYNITLS